MGNNEDTGFDFYTTPVTASGIQTPVDYTGDLKLFNELIHYDATTQLVYAEDGSIINPADGSIVGTFDASGTMVPDGANGKAYFLGQTQSQLGSTTWVIESFDVHHFTPVDTITIGNLVGNPQRLIRWGSSGLAFLTYGTGSLGTGGADSGDDLYVVNDSSFAGPSVPAESAPTFRVRAGLGTGSPRSSASVRTAGR